MPSIITVAQLKLAKLVADSSAAAVGRRVGSTGNTVRLLAAGGASPKVTTVERMRTLGIEPADWFTPASGAENGHPIDACG
jgi:hypothetical protein